MTDHPQSRNGFKSFVNVALSRKGSHVCAGLAILLLDLFTGRFLLFPILFVIPVGLSAWLCSARLAYTLAIILPLGRLLTDEFVHHPSPFIFIAANCLIRIAVLLLLAFLVSCTARQTMTLEKQIQSFVTICAWSRTVEYQGEWISFEDYLKRRFNMDTSHGISPAEAEKAFGNMGKSEANTDRRTPEAQHLHRVA